MAHHHHRCDDDDDVGVAVLMANMNASLLKATRQSLRRTLSSPVLTLVAVLHSSQDSQVEVVQRVQFITDWWYADLLIRGDQSTNTRKRGEKLVSERTEKVASNYRRAL